MGLSILIVEDSEPFREVLAELLNSMDTGSGFVTQVSLH
jgi:CheY-like chemotaxis protein